MNVALVDCGSGNLHSAEAGLRRAGASVKTTSAAADIDAADKVVLPGDGRFAAFMREMDSRGLRAPILRAAAQKPFLGICIGMQVLYEGSDEDPETPGLGLLRGRARKIPESEKIPHIGWNTTAATRPHPILRGVAACARFYFIHSYCCPPGAETVATAHYGATFAAVAAKDAIVAAQFHPEKSARPGAQLLQNFVAG